MKYSLGLIKTGLVKTSFVNYYKNKEIKTYPKMKYFYDPIKIELLENL